MRECKPLSIFIPHGATKLTDHDLHGDGLVQWAFIRELAKRGHRLTVVSPEVDIVGAIPENVDIHEVRGGSDMTLPQYIFHSYRIYRRLQRKTRFDFVHQMNPVVRGVTLPWVLSRTPIVLGTYVGDWPYEVPQYRMRKAGPALFTKMLVKMVLDILQQSFASKLLIATPFALNRVPLRKQMASRLAALSHAVDIERYSPEARQDDPIARPKSVLFIGLVSPHKGIGVLLEAFDIVHRSEPDAKLVVVGSGPMDDTIVAFAARGGWSDQLEFVGPVDNDRVPGWLRACTILCSTALGEPYGQTVVEAMSCGRPLVVNDSGGPRYIVAGSNNPVVPLGDPAALATAILALLRDPQRCSILSAQNRSLAEQRYSWPRVVDALEEIYYDVQATAT